MYQGGIVALLVQLAVHSGLVVAFFRSERYRFSALAMSLLLLQRPNFAISGYGYMTFLVLLLMLDKPGTRRARAPTLSLP